MLKMIHTGIPVLFILHSVIAQAPAIGWQKYLGGTLDDEARSIQQTADGGYIVAGFARSNDGDITGKQGYWDYWVVKLSDTGGIEWQKSLGGTGQDEARSIRQTVDGGYIVAGFSDSDNGDISENHGDRDYWIVKLDGMGNIEWEKSFGGTGRDEANEIRQTTDDGYIVAGLSASNNGDVTGNHGSMDYWVVKLSTTGSIEWQKCLGGTDVDAAYSIQQTTDGGYIVAGHSFSENEDVAGNQGGDDCWVVKLDGSGNIEWQKSLGGTGDDGALSVQQAIDGGYIVAGLSASNNGDVTGNHGAMDYWIIKLDDYGSIEWQKCLGGTGVDIAISIQQTTDGGYVVAGRSASNDKDVSGNHGATDYWVVKLDGTGNVEWQKCLGGIRDDVAYSIQQTTDGGYIVAGWSRSNDRNENIIGADYWVVKLTATGTEDPNISIYPNPAGNLLSIGNIPGSSTFSITDLAGKLVYSATIADTKTTISTADFINGLYIIRLEHDGEPAFSVCRKFVVIK